MPFWSLEGQKKPHTPALVFWPGTGFVGFLPSPSPYAGSAPPGDTLLSLPNSLLLVTYIVTLVLGPECILMLVVSDILIAS